MKNQKNNVILLFGLLGLVYFASYMTRLNFSAVKAILIEQNIFTADQTGIIGASLFFTYGAGQIISGILSDKINPVKIISAGLILTCVCNFLIPFSDSVLIISVIWGINGLAQAFFWPPIVRILDRYTDESGYTKGVWFVCMACYIATILIYFIIPLEVEWLDWTAAFSISAIFTLIVLIVWIVGFAVFGRNAVEIPHEKATEKSAEKAVNEENADAGKQGAKSGGMRTAVISSGMIFLMIAVAMQGFMKDGIQDWLPTLFTQSFDNVSAKSATFSNIILPIFTILTMSVSTVLYEKVFRNEVNEAFSLFAFSTALCVVLVLFYKNSAILMLLLCALINSCMHGVNTMFTCFAPRRFQKEGKVATVSGVFNAGSYLGSAISSYAIGNIAQNHGWDATLKVWTLVCVIGLAACVVSVRLWKKYISKA